MVMKGAEPHILLTPKSQHDEFKSRRGQPLAAFFIWRTEMVKRVKKIETSVEVGLRVVHNSSSYNTSECTSDEPYSPRGDTYTDWNVEGIELVDKYPEVTACFPITSGDTVFLVYAVYSTGDSFGHDEHHSIAFVDVFATVEKANLAATVIRDHSDWYNSVNRSYSRLTLAEKKALAKKYKNSYTFDIVRENGELLSVFASWNGYFESLSYVEVVGFTVDTGKRTRF